MFPRGRQDTQLISAHVCLFPARIPIIHTASYPLEPVGHHRLALTRGTCNNGATFLSVQNIIGEFTGGGSDKIRVIIGFVLFICTTIFDVVPELGDERHQCLFHFEPRVVTSKIYFHRRLATSSVCAMSVYTYPISLSYQAKTLTSIPSTTRVISRSAIAPNGSPKISADTSGSSLTANTRFHLSVAAAFFMAPWTSSTVVARLETNVMSTIEPTTTGTRTAMPSNFPISLGYASAVALAAPVEDGTRFCAPARPRRKSSAAGPSTMDCVAVYAWTVFSTARSMPIASSSIPISGLAAFVVHDAFEVMLQVPNFSSLAPIKIVSAPSPFAGAEMTTCLAPASRCAFALSAEVKNPVASITMSISRSRHGNFEGSRSASTGIFLPSTTRFGPSVVTVPAKRPYTVSYFKRYARFSGVVKSLMATTVSAVWLESSRRARRKPRPILPKPLIATLVIS